MAWLDLWPWLLLLGWLLLAVANRANRVVRLQFTVDKEVVMGLTLTDSGNQNVQLVGKTAKGNPAVLSGTVSWACSDANIVAMTVDPASGDKAALVAVGPLGTVTITATYTPVAAGSTPLVATLDVAVVGGDAASVQIVSV